MELKPCPFCRQQAIMQTHHGLDWDGKDKGGTGAQVGGMYGLWYVGCPSPLIPDVETKCEIGPSAQWYAKQEDAIKAWNRRAK